MDMDGQPEQEDKIDEEKWYVIGQVPLESDSLSISESEGYLDLPVARVASKPEERDPGQGNVPENSKENQTGKPPLYQEQWHDLEELKASLKTMGWPEESSDLSVSGQASSSNAHDSEKEVRLRPEEFAEPARRQTPNSLLSADLVGHSIDLKQAEGYGGLVMSDLNSPASLDSDGLANAQHGSMEPSRDQSWLARDDRGQTFQYPWFPSRPNAVGNDGIGDQFTATPFPAQHTSGAYLSTATSKETSSNETESPPPPQRSQPDGRDGSELKQRLAVKISAVAPTSAVALAPTSAVALAPASAVAIAAASTVAPASAVAPTSVLPFRADKDKFTSTDRPSMKNGVRAVQQQHIADHVAESPVSQLLGPNFKAAQKVLNQLKQDRLLSKGNEEEMSSNSSEAMLESVALTETSHITSQHVDKPRPQLQYREYKHSTPSSDDAASYSHTGVGAEILKEMEQRYSALSTEDSEQRYGALLTEDSGQRYGALLTEDSGQRFGVLPTEDSGQGYGVLPTEDSRRTYGILPTRDSGQMYGTLSTEGSGQTYGVLLAESSGQRHGALPTKDSGQRYGILPAEGIGDRYGVQPTEDSGQRHDALSTKDGEQRYGVLPAEGSGQRYGVLPTEDSGQRYGVLPAEGSGQRYGVHPTQDSGQRYGALLTEDSGQRSGALSTEDSGLNIGDSRQSSENASLFVGYKDKSGNSTVYNVENTRRSQERRHYSSSAHGSNASSNDTDDLLNYDAAVESDLQYLTEKREGNVRRSQPGRSRNFDGKKRPAASDSSGSTKRSIDVQLQETPDPGKDDDLTQYHMSLGAGVVTPLPSYNETPVPSHASSQSTVTAHSSPKGSSSSQESLKVQDIENGDTDDSPSSTELYQPVLPGASATHAASYGIYDIRRSSGPGSTNRRRRAMGLDPLSNRKERYTKSNDTVYVSGGSTPVGIDGAKIMSEDSMRNTSSMEQGRYEIALAPAEDSTEAVERLQKRHSLDPGHEKRIHPMDSAERLNDSPRVYPQTGRTRDSSSTNGSFASGVSGQPASLPGNVVGMKQTVSSRTSASVQHKKGWVPGFTPSTGKCLEVSAISSAGDGIPLMHKLHGRHRHAPKRPARLILAPSKTSHRYESDTLTSGTDSVASNISKLSQMIFRPMSEPSSVSSQTPDSTPVENARALHSRLAGSSSSEPSSTSGSFNSAFVEPKLRPSVEQQLKLREMLKNLGSCQTVGTRLLPESSNESSTGVESGKEHMPSSRKGKQKKTVESVPARMPSPTKEKQKTKPSFMRDRREKAGHCICGLQEQSRSKQPEASGGRNKGVYIAGRRTRDVAVNCSPDPEINIVEERRTTEDACTQTEMVIDLVERAKQTSHTGEQWHETVADRRPVLLTPPHKKYVSSRHGTTKKDVIQSKSPSKERPVTSENAPPLLSPTAAKHARKLGPTWFCPISNEHFSKPDVTRLDKFQVDLGARVQVPQSLQKLTLQEAFMTAKPDFIQRSRARVSEVKEASKSPRKPCFDTAYDENKTEESKPSTKSCKSSSSKNKVDHNCDHLHKPKPRKMLRNEMYEMNHRLYKNLPEVKARQEQNGRQAFYRTNRLRAQLFNKRVQNRLKLQRS